MSSLVTHAFCAKRPSCFSWPVERPEHIHTDILAAAVGTFLLLEGLTMLKPHCAPRLIKNKLVKVYKILRFHEKN